MKKSTRYASLAAAVALVLGSLPAIASPAAKSYQVTGPIVALTDTVITVQKGDEKWEVARTPETKVTGELKVGSKVTVYYTMTATKAEVK